MSGSPTTSEFPSTNEYPIATGGDPPPTDDKIHSAISSLSAILSVSVPPSPSLLLSDTSVYSAISAFLRRSDSGSGDSILCRWFYDTFQSSDPSLQLLVLNFVPIITGLYLPRVSLRRPQAGFEALLLALYAYETTSRAGQPIIVKIPDLSHPSIYHEPKESFQNDSGGHHHIAVLSPALDPHGTVRSTRRAFIVGVALELYHSRISEMPRESKLDFCEFCEKWAGTNGKMCRDHTREILDIEEDINGNRVAKEGRVPLPWELLRPVLRILGHCLFANSPIIVDEELFTAASAACRRLHSRSVHDINSKAILATESLLRLRQAALQSKNDVDHA